jgi:sarcosine oxidase
MKNVFHSIVVGLGAVGSAVAFQLARHGKSVLGIDQFSPPHAFGSSHGETRIARQAVGEGEQYTQLSLRSFELWRQIENDVGEQLLVTTGGLIIGDKDRSGAHHGSRNFLQATISASEKHGIRHDVLNAAEIRKRFPQFNVGDNDVAYYEYEAGFLRPEACVKANLTLATRYGATIRTNERVESFKEVNGMVAVKTDNAEYAAERLIVSAGAWLPAMLDHRLAHLFSACRQVMYWFAPRASIDQFLPGAFPIFIWRLAAEEQGMYGFPAIDGPRGGVKIATSQYRTTTTPDQIDRAVSREEVQLMYERYVKPYFPGLEETCVRTAACLYTVTPDFNFVIDQHPSYPSVLVASACSGHGFKHAAAIGEALAQTVISGASKIGLDEFRVQRLLR